MYIFFEKGNDLNHLKWFKVTLKRSLTFGVAFLKKFQPPYIFHSVYYRRPTSNHITFGFHHMHQNNGMDCMLKLKWRLAERNLQWNFFTLSFQECYVEVRLAIDFATVWKNSSLSLLCKWSIPAFSNTLFLHSHFTDHNWSLSLLVTIALDFLMIALNHSEMNFLCVPAEISRITSKKFSK